MSDVTVEDDLRHRLGRPRDQGPRPTCLVFAVSDTHAAVRGAWEPLSCEYLYYHATRRDGAGPEDGTTLSAVLAAVEQDGQPIEEMWPYLAKSPADTASWLPPDGVEEVFRCPGEVIGSSFDDAWSLVADGRPAVIAMTLSDAFYQPREGIVQSDEAVGTARRHAVVAVATGNRRPSRFLLVRNSWGRAWGTDGHAWLAEAYLTPRIIRVLALKEVA